MRDALLETNLNLPNKRSGKVRDLYDVTLGDGGEALLIVATDRISAFDVVMELLANPGLDEREIELRRALQSIHPGLLERYLAKRIRLSPDPSGSG